MKKLIYQVYVSKRSKLYDHCTASVERYAKRIGADYICQTAPQLMIRPDPFVTNRSKESYEKYGGYLPIYEKENAFAYLSSDGEYDQLAIIDADVYIRETAPDIFEDIKPDSDFGGVIERDMPITPEYREKIINYSRMQYSTLNHVDWNWNGNGAEFFNMGVMVMNRSFSKYYEGKTPKEFLTQPRFKQFIDGMGAWKWSTDQTLLNTWLKEENMKVTHLNYVWNGMYNAIVPKAVPNCHFVHFFLRSKLPNHGENVEALMKDIGEA